MADINKEFIEYLLTCPQVEWMYSLFGEVKDKTKHLYREANGTNREQRYLDGSRYVEEYADFKLICYETANYQWQAPEDDENLTEYQNCQAICDWVEEQQILGNLPQFTDRICESIEARPGNPQIAGADDNGIIKYFVGIRVNFEGRLI